MSDDVEVAPPWISSNIKTFDIFSGYRNGYGHSVLHIDYFITMLHMIPQEKDDLCTTANFTNARKVLLAAHITIWTLNVIGYIGAHCL